MTTPSTFDADTMNSAQPVSSAQPDQQAAQPAQQPAQSQAVPTKFDAATMQTAQPIPAAPAKFDAATMQTAQPVQAQPPQPNPKDEASMFGQVTGGAAIPKSTTPMQTVPSPSNIGTRAWQATKDEAGNLVSGTAGMAMGAGKIILTPPQTAREHAIASVGGISALAAYRASQKVGDAAENFFKAKREDLNQTAIDLLNATREFHDKDYRSALADTASAVSDAGRITGEPIHEMGRTREIAQGTKEGGDVVTPVTKDVVDLGALALAEKAPEIVRGVGKVAGKTAEIAGDVAGKVKEVPAKIAELRPDMLTKRPETPAPQHGTPVRVESPLDSPTVGKQLGGKDLSAEALDTLRKHVGDKIPVGGTAKGKLMEAVEPVQRTISETASKMNKTVADAHPFTTSVAQDSVFGEGTLTKDIGTMKEQLPPSVRQALGQDVDAVMQDADKALNSTDASEVLEYRRQLGNKIDWDDIQKNPTTAAEVQNAARAKVYRALGNKIHTEIPETLALDKTLQPNLELRSHMTKKLGERAVADPQASAVEAQTELRKGKTQVENAAHNETVARNQKIAWTALAPIIGGIIGVTAFAKLKSFFE